MREKIKKFKETYLDNMKYKLFKDEDAYLGYFTHPKNNRVQCYVSPNFINGYWENHTL